MSELKVVKSDNQALLLHKFSMVNLHALVLHAWVILHAHNALSTCLSTFFCCFCCLPAKQEMVSQEAMSHS